MGFSELVKAFGKAPGFAGLAYTALGSASFLTLIGSLDAGSYVMALAVILGAHFGGGAAVAKRDNGKVAPVDSNRIEGRRSKPPHLRGRRS